MKVLFITNIPSPYRVDFFNELGKLCDLTVTFEGQTATDRNTKWKAREAVNFTAISLKGKRTGIDTFFSPDIIRVIRKGWDKIIVGMYSTPTSMLAIEYMRIHKIPFYIESDGGFVKAENKLKFLFKKHFISSASGWLSSGEPTSNYLQYYGADRQKCYVYPFTSLSEKDLEAARTLLKTEKETLRAKTGFEEDYIVLSVGRFSYEEGYGKGYDAVLRAAEKTDKTVGFYIVGDEPTAEFEQWKADKKLDHVHFVGFKTKDELMPYYAAADLFVLMTKSDVWGLVINEAMMYGLPVITTDMCNAGLELIQNEVNGYVIPVGDSDKLQKCVSNLKNEKEKAHSMSVANIEKIKRYTIEKMAQRHMEILEGQP